MLFLPPTWRDAVPKNIQIPIYVFPAPRICIWNVYFVCYKAEPHIGHRPNEPPSQWEAFIAAFISREVLLATHSKSEQVWALKKSWQRCRQQVGGNIAPLLISLVFLGLSSFVSTAQSHTSHFLGFSWFSLGCHGLFSGFNVFLAGLAVLYLPLG